MNSGSARRRTGAVHVRRATGLVLALAGTAVGAALVACAERVAFLEPKSFDGYRFWIVGDVARPGLAVIVQLLPFRAVGVALALSLGHRSNALARGRTGWSRRSSGGRTDGDKTRGAHQRTRGGAGKTAG
ncbi:iron chelate uptake ABC transporter family permease subunit [Amycolatopsis sp. cmx-11-51]|uniref:iron chelate uptake ABC transporter family permease subunit n=1 Tax=unclassified Amycolatopsis TaxID=2618356 RepID=UPI0039E24EE7